VGVNIGMAVVLGKVGRVPLELHKQAASIHSGRELHQIGMRNLPSKGCKVI
jgi:hypothetical protein